jgi:hypothetical protein
MEHFASLLNTFTTCIRQSRRRRHSFRPRGGFIPEAAARGMHIYVYVYGDKESRRHYHLLPHEGVGIIITAEALLVKSHEDGLRARRKTDCSRPHCLLCVCVCERERVALAK